MEPPVLRKPKLYFDAAPHASHVTFDDGKDLRRNIPWSLYVEARWEYLNLQAIALEIGDWLVVLKGNNLEPLFRAIEEHTLVRVCAHADWANSVDRAMDTYLTEIQFTKQPPGMAARKRGQIELDLGPLGGLA